MKYVASSRLAHMMPRALRYGLLAALAVGGVLLFLLASASGNTAFFERNYPLLLGINGVIAALLFVLVLALIRRLVLRLRAKQFGARMMMRFTVAFALMGVLPGVLIYVVSTQFLSRSIESWFDVRVDRALDSGLTLGRAALDNLKDDVSNKARSWALELSDIPESAQLSQLNRLREQGGDTGRAYWLSGQRTVDRSQRFAIVPVGARGSIQQRAASGAHAAYFCDDRGRGRRT